MNHTTKLPFKGEIIQVHWQLQGMGLLLIMFLSFSPKLFHIQEYLFFTLLLIAITFIVYERKGFPVATPIDLPLLMFVVYCLISIPFALDPSYSFSEWRKLLAQVLVFYWAVFVIAKLDDHQIILRGCLVAVLGGSVVSLIGVYYTGAYKEFLPYGNLSHTPYSSNIVLATYAVMVLPITFACLTMTDTGWKKFAYLLGMVAILLGLIYSGSRACYLAVFVQSLSVLLLYRRARWRSLIIIIAILSALLILWYSGQGTTLPERIIERFGFWEMGIAAVMTSPVFGIGYGNESMEIFALNNGLAFEGGHLHNWFLSIMVGAGIPALILMMWWIILALKSLFFQMTSASSSKIDVGVFNISSAVAVMGIGFFVRNAFDYQFSGSLASLFWILLAIGFGAKMEKWNQAR